MISAARRVALAQGGSPAWMPATVVYAVAAAGCLALAIAAPQPIVALGIGVLVLIAVWATSAERYERSLVVLLLYVGLLDGYLKLKTGTTAVTLGRDVLLYSIVVGVVVRAIARRETMKPPPLTGWVVAWVICVLVQLVNPDNGSFVHSLGSVRPHLEWVPLFFLAYMAMRSTKVLRAFLLLIAIVAAINGAVSLVQFNLTSDQLASWGPGYADAIRGTGSVSGRTFADRNGVERTRPFALGSDSGFGGEVGVIAAPAILALFSLRRLRGAARLALLPLAALTVIAILTSQSRTSLLEAIIALLAFAGLAAASKRTLQVVLSVGVVVAVTFVVVSSLASSSETGSFDRYQSIAPNKVFKTSVDYRKATIGLVPEYVTKYPLGAGLGSVGPGAAFAAGPADPTRALDGESELTFLIIEVGVAGLIVFAALTIRILYLATRRIRRVADADARICLAAIAAPLFASVLAWVSGITSATTPMAPFFWFAAGTLVYWLHPRSSPLTSGSE